MLAICCEFKQCYVRFFSWFQKMVSRNWFLAVQNENQLDNFRINFKLAIAFKCFHSFLWALACVLFWCRATWKYFDSPLRRETLREGDLDPKNKTVETFLLNLRCITRNKSHMQRKFKNSFETAFSWDTSEPERSRSFKLSFLAKNQHKCQTASNFTFLTSREWDAFMSDELLYVLGRQTGFVGDSMLAKCRFYSNIYIRQRMKTQQRSTISQIRVQQYCYTDNLTIQSVTLFMATPHVQNLSKKWRFRGGIFFFQ